MTAITLALREPPAQAVDCSPLVPGAIAGRTRQQIESIELACGNRRLPLKAIFAVSGSDTTHVIIRDSTDRLERIGAGMRDGFVEVEGDCGAYAGSGMRGGRLRVSGNAGAFAASAMRDGLIEIRGNAAHFLGAALAGDKQGMRGGTVLVHGNAGSRCGDRMRRGLLLIKGDCGDYCGSRMLAGTIMVRGRAGAHPGFALRRGTLLLANMDTLPATFQDCGEHMPLFLTLLERHMARAGELFFAFLPLPKRVRRYCGDLATGGTGEILLAV